MTYFTEEDSTHTTMNSEGVLESETRVSYYFNDCTIEDLERLVKDLCETPGVEKSSLKISAETSHGYAEYTPVLVFTFTKPATQKEKDLWEKRQIDAKESDLREYERLKKKLKL